MHVILTPRLVVPPRFRRIFFGLVHWAILDAGSIGHLDQQLRNCLELVAEPVFSLAFRLEHPIQ